MAQPRFGRFPIDPAGIPFALPAAGLLILGVAMAWPVLWVPALLLLVIFLGFFRDPPRRIPSEPGAVVAPADGLVDSVRTNENPEAGEVGGPVISIFLSVFDVHVNRAPVAGTVESLSYRPGAFVNAMKTECADCNESNWIFMRADGHRVTVRQIAGLIARRIVCRVAPGETVRRGQRIGIIRFGSRTELYLPVGAQVKVSVGQRVKGAATIVARMPEQAR